MEVNAFMKRLTHIFTLLILAFAVALAGCSNGGGNSAKEGGSEAAPTANPELSSNEPGWKHDTSPVTLKWYTGVSGYSKKWDAKNNFVDKLITEESGITVDFVHAGNDVNSEFNVMLATGNLPDIITLDRWNSTALIQTLMESGAVAPLNELMEQYDPYFATIVPDSLKDWYTQEDGNYYGIPNYFVSPEMLEQYPDVKPYYHDKSNGQIIVRQDLMEQLGIKLEDLQQEDSLIAALKKVKEANLKYDGVNVVPLYFDDKEKYLSDSLGVLAGSFGAVSEREDGSYTDVRRTAEYKHMLQFVNKLGREGLLSLENFTSARNQIEEKMNQGGIFMRIGNLADYTSPVTMLYQEDPNARYANVGPIHSSDGSKPQFGRALNKGWTLTFINKKSKNADRAIRFIGYLYSEHGQTVNSFGKEGETYTVTAEGKLKLNPDIEKALTEDWNSAVKEWGFDSIWWLTNDVWQKHVKEVTETELTTYLDNLFYGTKDYMFNNDVLDSGNLFDAYAPGSEEAKADAKIAVYWAQVVPKLIFAKSDQEFESLYTEAIATLDQLGLPSIEGAKNARVQEFKAASGVTLVSPKYTGSYN